MNPTRDLASQQALLGLLRRATLDSHRLLKYDEAYPEEGERKDQEMDINATNNGNSDGMEADEEEPSALEGPPIHDSLQSAQVLIAAFGFTSDDLKAAHQRISDPAHTAGLVAHAFALAPPSPSPKGESDHRAHTEYKLYIPRNHQRKKNPFHSMLSVYIQCMYASTVH